VSADCLVSNRRSQGLEEIFQRLNQRRAELALILIQRLIESNADRKEMQGLLAIIWETIQNSDASFERALTARDAEYYRTLLKLLFLALRVHAANNDQVDLDFKASTRLKDSESIIPIIVELLERIVANGIRDLAAFIHDKPTEANPEDIALVTGELSYSHSSAYADSDCSNSLSDLGSNRSKSIG
jgi:nuclear pore complex protein Nup188